MTALITALRIAMAADKADRAADHLQRIMLEACPGPHRFDRVDGRPARCLACGYQIDGHPTGRDQE